MNIALLAIWFCNTLSCSSFKNGIPSSTNWITRYSNRIYNSYSVWSSLSRCQKINQQIQTIVFEPNLLRVLVSEFRCFSKEIIVMTMLLFTPFIMIDLPFLKTGFRFFSQIGTSYILSVIFSLLIEGSVTRPSECWMSLKRYRLRGHCLYEPNLYWE